MSFNPNQFQIQRQAGSLTSDPNFNIFTCKIDATQLTDLTYGDAVTIVASTSGLLSVIGATSASSNIFGFINYSIKKEFFSAGDYVAVAVRNSVMFMTASAAINAGAEVQFDPSTTKIATQTTGNTVIGIAMEKAAGDASIIPVYIVTPLTVPALSASFTPGTVVASELVAVDASKDISIFNNLSAVNLKAGASGTVGTVTVYPATASRGSFGLTATNQTGNTAVTINADAMGQATVIHAADPGLAASYLAQSTAALTVAEVDMLDASAQTETILVTGPVSVTKRISNLSAASGAYAVTLAVPNAVMLGQVKVIQMTVAGNALTLALTNVTGGGGTTCTFTNVDDTLVLVGGLNKWNYVSAAGAVIA